jgi:hypothetical protein
MLILNGFLAYMLTDVAQQTQKRVYIEKISILGIQSKEQGRDGGGR